MRSCAEILSLGEEGIGLPRTGHLSWSCQADLCIATGPQDPCQSAARMAYLYVMLMGFLLLSMGAVAFVLDHFTVGFCPWACLPKPSWLPICLSRVPAPACPFPTPFLSQIYTEKSPHPKHMLYSPEVVFNKYFNIFNRNKTVLRLRPSAWTSAEPGAQHRQKSKSQA